MSAVNSAVGSQDTSAVQDSSVLQSVERGFWDVLQAPLLEVAQTTITPLLLGTAAGVVLLGWIGSRTAQRVMHGLLRRRGVTDAGVTGTAGRLVHYAVMILAMLLALRLVGIDLSTLFAAGALAAVAIGFALQHIIENFVAGVILLVDRSITPDDVLEVDGRMVRVVDMRIRSTIARTRDEEEIIIPNSTLVQSSVTNFTLRDTSYRLRTNVGVAYESDVDQVFEVLKESVMGVAERDPAVDPAVLFLDFGDSALLFDVSIWVNDPWASRSTRSTMNHRIWRALKDHGITVAFPQLDVHVRTPGGAS